MYFIEQRVFFVFFFLFLILEFHRLEHSSTATHRSFQNRLNAPVRPNAKTIRMLFAKFERTFRVAGDRKDLGKL